MPNDEAPAKIGFSWISNQYKELQKEQKRIDKDLDRIQKEIEKESDQIREGSSTKLLENLIKMYTATQGHKISTISTIKTLIDCINKLSDSGALDEDGLPENYRDGIKKEFGDGVTQ